jgi:hypothetical protein
MKFYKKLIIISIIVTVICITISTTYLINEYIYDQGVKQRYEAELRRRKETLYYKELQKEADQNTKLQYELMLQTIKDNSDYYISFSKEFLSKFETYGYDEYYDTYGVFYLEKVKDKLENVFNRDVLGYEGNCFISNTDGIILVNYRYNYMIKGVSYPSDRHDYYERGCSAGCFNLSVFYSGKLSGKMASSSNIAYLISPDPPSSDLIYSSLYPFAVALSL